MIIIWQFMFSQVFSVKLMFTSATTVGIIVQIAVLFVYFLCYCITCMRLTKIFI